MSKNILTPQVLIRSSGKETSCGTQVGFKVSSLKAFSNLMWTWINTFRPEFYSRWFRILVYLYFNKRGRQIIHLIEFISLDFGFKSFNQTQPDLYPSWRDLFY